MREKLVAASESETHEHESIVQLFFFNFAFSMFWGIKIA